jgi:hypothetical protein
LDCSRAARIFFSALTQVRRWHRVHMPAGRVSAQAPLRPEVLMFAVEYGLALNADGHARN